MANHQHKIRFALFGNTFQEKKSMPVQKFLAIAEQNDAEITINRPFYDFLMQRQQINIPKCQIFEGYDFQADYAVCMGGDGTFLDVAAKVREKQTPIIGFNTGRLGFLATLSPDDIEDIIQEICDLNVSIEQRGVLKVECEEVGLGINADPIPFALNEVAVLKHDISSMISITTYIDQEYLTTYQADGLIVGTPTGSTAYALSVGGPIIVPQANSITLTPVAPHSLNMRPIVINDTSEIEMVVSSRSGSFLVAIDGRSTSYPDQIHLKVKKADHKVNVVVRKGHNFFTTLRKKMMWGVDQRS